MAQEKFDTLLLSRARLGILSALMHRDELEFTHLRDSLSLSDGNLSVQIGRLEEAGYITVKKMFVEKKPRTFCRITAKGVKAVRQFASTLENIVGEK